MDAERLFSTAEVAQRLQVSPAFVRDHVRSGKWPGMRFGRWYRFSQEDIHQIERISRIETVPTRDTDRIRNLLRKTA